jgi:hypothetical protein
MLFAGGMTVMTLTMVLLHDSIDQNSLIDAPTEIAFENVDRRRHALNEAGSMPQLLAQILSRFPEECRIRLAVITVRSGMWFLNVIAVRRIALCFGRDCRRSRRID